MKHERTVKVERHDVLGHLFSPGYMDWQWGIIKDAPDGAEIKFTVEVMEPEVKPEIRETRFKECESQNHKDCDLDGFLFNCSNCRKRVCTAEGGPDDQLCDDCHARAEAEKQRQRARIIYTLRDENPGTISLIRWLDCVQQGIAAWFNDKPYLLMPSNQMAYMVEIRCDGDKLAQRLAVFDRARREVNR